MNISALGEGSKAFTWQQAMALALATGRGLSYRQIAQRLDCSDRDAARFIREGLSIAHRYLPVGTRQPI